MQTSAVSRPDEGLTHWHAHVLAAVDWGRGGLAQLVTEEVKPVVEKQPQTPLTGFLAFSAINLAVVAALHGILRVRGSKCSIDPISQPSEVVVGREFTLSGHLLGHDDQDREKSKERWRLVSQTLSEEVQIGRAH